MLDEAMKYAQRGWYIFPVRQKGKTPMIKDWPNLATTDEKQVTAWWTQWPQANIGIATGKNSNLVVLDVDLKPGGKESLQTLETPIRRPAIERTMNLSPEEIRRLVPVEKAYGALGGMLDSKGRGPCLFPQNHQTGDSHPSVAVKNERAKCWAQGCLGENGADIFDLVKLSKGYSFPEAKTWLMEEFHLNGNKSGRNRRIIRRYLWTDDQGNNAYHIRWEGEGRKFTWAQNPDGQTMGRGE